MSVESFEIFHAAVEKLKISNREVLKLAEVLSRNLEMENSEIFVLLCIR